MPFRVSLEQPSTPESYIIGLNIRGQFFSDLWLSFSQHCNAFIGVKGSGKTSVLECLRFALGSPVPESRKEEVDNHLHNILGPAGVVHVLVKRKDGAKVLVKRSINSPQILNLRSKMTGRRKCKILMHWCFRPIYWVGMKLNRRRLSLKFDKFILIQSRVVNRFVNSKSVLMTKLVKYDICMSRQPIVTHNFVPCMSK